MLIAICGYGSSGASAVVDFLRGYKNLQVVPFEFQIIHQADGISDLKYHLTVSRERVACNAAILRFKKLMLNSFSGHRLRKIVGKDYEAIVQRFLSRITLAEWKGRSNYDPPDVSDRSPNRYICQIQRGITALLRKANKNWCFPGYRTRYFSIMEEEEFNAAVRDFLNELFCAAGYDLHQDLMLDMLLSVSNPGWGSEFFDDIRTIIVSRDPRDIYVRSRANVFIDAFLPQDSVEGFITYYGGLKKKRLMPPNAIEIQFEDLIYHYQQTSQTIMDFLGYRHRPENEFAYFDPDKSVKNTNIYPKETQHAEAIRKIEAALPEYLYEFQDYKPLRVTNSLEGS